MAFSKLVTDTIPVYAVSVGGRRTAICKFEAAARRLAKGSGEYGSEAHVTELHIVKIDGEWYVPKSIANILYPTENDLIEQKRLDIRAAALKRATELGMTQEEINALAAK